MMLKVEGGRVDGVGMAINDGIDVHYHYRPDGFRVLCGDPAPVRSAGSVVLVTCADCLVQWSWRPEELGLDLRDG